MSLDARDFDTVQMQAVVYTPGGQLAVSRVLVSLLEKWAELFNGEPIVLPGDIPSEVPRLILQSQDNHMGLEINGERAVFVWNKQTDKESFGKERFLKFAYEVLRFYLNAAPAKAGRLALICRRVLPSQQPAKRLAAHFCQQRWLNGPLNRPENFELHAHKSYDLTDEFRINSWMRCRVGKVSLPESDSEAPETQPCLLVEQDLNTLREIADEIVFSEEQIWRFYMTASHECDAVLALYFPGDEHDTNVDQP